MPENSRFTFIDLFAGIGGIRMAFESLGGDCVFASEWDKHAQVTYEANFGHLPEGDITQISDDQVPDHDILTAGFPCQPFSIAGVTKHNALGNAHGFEHTQGTLFFDIARIISARRPVAFLLENVKNLLCHDRGKTFSVIREVLEQHLGYHVFHQVIDARRLVPQHRERVFIVGFRDSVDFEFPVIPDLKPRLSDILAPKVPSKYTLSSKLWQYLRFYAEKHRARGNGFGYGLAPPDGVTRTLSARYYKDGSEILIAQRGKNPRRLTPRECARLMGFPEWFEIVSSDTQAYRQFGNSVVVPIVRVIAGEIVQCLIRRTKAKQRRLEFSLQQPGKFGKEYLSGEKRITGHSPGENPIKAGTV
ncbi:MAG: DNA (cytosine-5-)-methyltransferase [Gammaproteobacteria bacterium]|nr:DNA (cytosine-5-)-methyltransferase [Gammaproteobacteria bacterium]